MISIICPPVCQSLAFKQNANPHLVMPRARISDSPASCLPTFTRNTGCAHEFMNVRDGVRVEPEVEGQDSTMTHLSGTGAKGKLYLHVLAGYKE